MPCDTENLPLFFFFFSNAWGNYGYYVYLLEFSIASVWDGTNFKASSGSFDELYQFVVADVCGLVSVTKTRFRQSLFSSDTYSKSQSLEK
jgi:hypothetical protein